MNRHVRAVLLDAVGTLIWPDPPVAVAYHRAGQRFGSRRSIEQIQQRFPAAFARQEQAFVCREPQRSPAPGAAQQQPDFSRMRCTHDDALHRRPTSEHQERLRWQRIVAEVFDDVGQAEGPLFEYLWDHFAQSRHWRVFDDVLPAWQQLQARGLLVGIASNFDQRLEVICRELQPLSHCEHVFQSAAVGYLKPSREFFRAIEQQLGLAADQLLLVGDDPDNDFYGAQAAGWQALLLDRQAARSHRHTIRRLTEVLG